MQFEKFVVLNFRQETFLFCFGAGTTSDWKNCVTLENQLKEYLTANEVDQWLSKYSICRVITQYMVQNVV